MSHPYIFQSSFVPIAGICAFVQHSAAASRVPNADFSGREFQLMWLKLRFSSFSHYFCIVSGSPTVLTLPFFSLSSSIERLPITDPRNHSTILGDLNVHDREWQLRSSGMFVMSLTIRCGRQFISANRSPHMYTWSNWPSCSNLWSYPHFNCFLYSNIYIRSPAGSSEHCAITTPVNFTRHNHPPSLRHILALQFGLQGRFPWILSFLTLGCLLFHLGLFHTRFQLYWYGSSSHEPFYFMLFHTMQARIPQVI